MNCDQAFDCLTDPARRHSPQLEEHLAHCERCRQMHDTLEPALDLFDELIPEPDLSGRTAATQTLAPEAVRVAEQAASRLEAANGPRAAGRRGLILRYAAAAMAGAMLMGVMGTINQAPPDSHAANAGRTDGVPPLPAVQLPADDSLPTQDQAPCAFLTGVIDRQAYPTATAVARRCADCHHDADAAPFPARAQPISIEIPVELDDEAADLIVRTLSARQQSLFVAAKCAAPRGDAAQFA